MDRSQIITWLTGAPLRVVAVIVVAVIAQAVLTRLVHRTITAAIRVPRIVRLGDTSDLARLRADQRAKAVGSLLTSSLVFAIWTVAVITALSQVGLDVAPLIASAGVIGVAVGLGAQSLVKDYLAGIFMVIEDQFGVGDVVNLSDVEGTVEEVRLRVTRIRGTDGTTWYVRNGELMKVGNKSQTAL